MSKISGFRASNWSREVLGGVPEAYLSDHRGCPSFTASHRACSMLTPSKVYDPAIDGLNGCQIRVRRSILPQSTTWIYFYGAPSANIGHVAQFRLAVLLRRRFGWCSQLLTFVSHARACFYRVMLSTHAKPPRDVRLACDEVDIGSVKIVSIDSIPQ